jgi:hypothetical protein
MRWFVVWHPSFGFWSGNGAPEGAPKDFALVISTAKTLGIGFGDLCGHAKPWF